MRKLVKFWFALIAIIVFTNGASAQQPSTIFLGNLFKGDEFVDLADGAAQKFKDAARRARDDLAPGQCPKTTITMSLPKGDDLFREAVLKAQRDILQGLLGGNAHSFVFNLDWKGTSASVQIDPVTDNAAPRITVSPPSGTKMKSGRGQTITVTATEPESGWQSGIKRIQLEDVDQHSNLQLWNNDAPTPRPCGNAGLTKTIEATAEVPERPVWHLRVTAFDYSNNRVVEQVEYPTGDWSGTLDLLFITPAYRNHARLDITIDYDGRSNLTGRIWEGKVSAEKTAGMPCALAVASPAMLSATLIGQYTPRTSTMSLTMRDEKVVMGHLVCPPVSGSIDYGHGLLSEPKLAELLRSFTTKDDGSVDETREDSTVPQNHVTIKLKLHRAQK